jgi:hypothetical protein
MSHNEKGALRHGRNRSGISRQRQCATLMGDTKSVIYVSHVYQSKAMEQKSQKWCQRKVKHGREQWHLSKAVYDACSRDEARC